MSREKFDKTMEKELLKNDFDFYDDWKPGPQSGWSTGRNFHTLSLMEHASGYWIILKTKYDKRGINMGSSNNAKDIISIRDALARLW